MLEPSCVGTRGKKLSNEKDELLQRIDTMRGVIHKALGDIHEAKTIEEMDAIWNKFCSDAKALWECPDELQP